MAVSPKLVDFVVDLVVDSAKRERFHGGDRAAREQMMSEAGLNDAEKAAIRDGNAASLEQMLNTQIIIPTTKKAPARKPAKKAPAKKAPTKKAVASRAAGKKAAKRKR